MRKELKGKKMHGHSHRHGHGHSHGHWHQYHHHHHEDGCCSGEPAKLEKAEAKKVERGNAKAELQLLSRLGNSFKKAQIEPISFHCNQIASYPIQGSSCP
ncbi:hypothetical protein C1H46_001912 [Malus baccata]|uniref:Uncharacterized protein n=1 Tax=Malus baccata TaxID=106549 RepID=A0A540NNC9_MALBA|nr:hypothetical protein C1H46_001912 [Malus baccata]